MPAGLYFFEFSWYVSHRDAFEMEDHIQFLPVLRDEIWSAFRGNTGTLPDDHGIPPVQDLLSQLPQVVMQPRAGGIIVPPVAAEVPLQLFGRDFRPGCILGNKTDRVHPESIHALIQPESKHFIYFPSYDGVAPIQILLVLRKIVQVPGIRRFVVFPGLAIRVKKAAPVW